MKIAASVMATRETEEIALITLMQDAQSLHPVIHAPARLAIMVALTRRPVLSHSQLEELLMQCGGNVSNHLSRLESCGYVRCVRRFENRIPRTEYTVTPEGLAALRTYLEQFQAVIDSVRCLVPSG